MMLEGRSLHRHSVGQKGHGGDTVKQHHHVDKLDHWSGIVRQNQRREMPLRMNITLVRSPDGRPKFFNCALTPVDASTHR